jgi:predicted KAP-like P-loop ATPase
LCRECATAIDNKRAAEVAKLENKRRADENNIKLEEITYFSDSPLKTPDPTADELKRYPFAKRVAESIVSLRNPNSIVIGVYGEWGEGKTTTLKFIEHRLAELNQEAGLTREGASVMYFWFNPWHFHDESNLLLSFFQTLAKALKDPPSTIRDKLSDKLGLLSESVLNYMERLSFISIPIGPIQFSPSDFAAEINKDRSSKELEDVKKSIEKQLSDARLRIVVFMDDIDRLDTAEVQMLFKLVKLTANFCYTVYILAFDEEMVAKALEKVYPEMEMTSAGGRSPGHAFLEKIVQVPLQLPQASALSLLLLYSERIKQMLSDVHVDMTDTEWNQFQTRFINGLLVSTKTPRRFTRYMNTLAFALPLLKDEVDPSDLMLIEGLRVFYPTLYSLIKNNSNVFLGTLFDVGFQDEEDRKQTEQYWRDIIQDALKTYGREQQTSARNLLLTLFPRLASIFGTMDFFSDQEKQQWIKEKRVATEEYFERYFAYTIPVFDISDKELDEFILNSKDLSTAEIDDKIVEFINKANSVKFLSKLAHRIQDLSAEGRLPNDSLVKIVITTTLFGNIVPQSERVYSNLTADIWFSLLKLIPDGETRFNVATIAAEKVEPITFIFECFKNVCALNRKETEIPFSKNEQDELCGIIVDRIKHLAELSPIYTQYPKYAPFFLRMWSRAVSRAETDEYLQKTLEKNPTDVFNLIRSCLLNGEKQEFLDGFLEIHSLTDCELIMSVVDAEVVRGTLRSMYSYLRSEELKKQLPDAYEERLAFQFERCCRNFEKNRAAYESGDSTIY